MLEDKVLFGVVMSGFAILNICSFIKCTNSQANFLLFVKQTVNKQSSRISLTWFCGMVSQMIAFCLTTYCYYPHFYLTC